MKNLTWQNPEQLFVAQELINKVKSKCCGIKALQENFGKQTIHSANLYQIYAYVTNEDIDKNGYQKGNVDGMLLYAMTEEYGKKSERIKLKAGNVIYVKTLDLSQDFEEIKKQLEEFALCE